MFMSILYGLVDWYPQPMFTAEQAVAGLFCLDMPFWEKVCFCQTLTIFVNILSILVDIQSIFGQYFGGGGLLPGPFGARRNMYRKNIFRGG